MGGRIKEFSLILRRWTLLRIIELLIFYAVFLTAGELIPGFRSGGLENSSKIALGVTIYYGLFFLYWPLTFTLSAFMKSTHRWFGAADLAFFLTHSVIAMSAAYNGIFGLSERINYLSPLVLAWGAVAALKAMFVLLSIMRES
jgi:hypothetical protein